ncbi:hypothetical protein FOZ60_017033 [Perkinsus olseni]|uniref:Uncharacterized protein n=1 Tax=Perkinsus olseni TaxID=32597 RepID=A0A7J6P3J7_PEROL|nr:hypothetical protein FOZ60_017033 [Perkinsus olseni]
MLKSAIADLNKTSNIEAFQQAIEDLASLIKSSLSPGVEASHFSTSLRPSVFKSFMELFGIDHQEIQAIMSMLTTGTPLGINEPIPYSVYWPTAKPKAQCDVRKVNRDYKSVLLNEHVVNQKFQDEVSKGFMKWLSKEEQQHRDFAPMALLVKSNAPENEADRIVAH